MGASKAAGAGDAFWPAQGACRRQRGALRIEKCTLVEVPAGSAGMPELKSAGWERWGFGSATQKAERFQGLRAVAQEISQRVTMSCRIRAFLGCSQPQRRGEQGHSVVA